MSRSRALLLFIHGWGFDRSVWDAVRRFFAPTDTLAWDFGYFGAPDLPAPPPGRPILAIGHSFGLLWLLHQRELAPELTYDGLVSVNGFSCFAARPDFPGIAPRLLRRMQSRLAADPAEVVANFRALCGVATPLPAEPVPERLAAGLEALQNLDCRPAIITGALCGTDDSLVAPAMSRACFAEAQLRWHEGGHMLPLTAPEWCARQLRDFAAAM